MDATGKAALKTINEVIDQTTAPERMPDPAEALEVLEELEAELEMRIAALRDDANEEDLEE